MRDRTQVTPGCAAARIKPLKWKRLCFCCLTAHKAGNVYLGCNRLAQTLSECYRTKVTKMPGFTLKPFTAKSNLSTQKAL